ncbi:MAG TPA: wax ester/triacylglycerol synthase family O-acyltransferase [Acidimicrobiales bacterium]|nr:wax ester/triacylglycerol synthase family O-acyltransferase [Acidimicrobiales bacterium]
MSRHSRLSALDAGFLSLEGPDTPMHVGSVILFEGAPLRDRRGRIRLAALRDLIEARLDLVPRYRQIPVEGPLGMGRPFWVDDARFDIAHHVKITAVRAPGGRRELLELACELHTELLDRSRPLWELWVVDGLADGRVGMIQKTHHAMVDGIAGVDVAAAMMDLDRHPPRRRGPRPPTAWVAEPGVGVVEAGRAVIGDVLAVPTGLSSQAARLLRNPPQRLGRAVHLAGGAGSLARSGLVAPRMSINRPIVRRRRTLDGLTVSLAATRAAGAAVGATVNDVVLAGVAGGLRNLLLCRGEPLRPARALVPVSTRAASARGQLGNAVAAILADLPVDETDPVRRLETVAAGMRRRKAAGQADVTGALIGMADRVPARVAAGLARAVHHQPFVNLVVTNVPGSPLPLYLIGARLEEVVPIVPLARNLDLSVGILSYGDQLSFGILADSGRMPDVHVMTAGIERSLAELLPAARKEVPA